jgi:hypothetical protein
MLIKGARREQLGTAIERRLFLNLAAPVSLSHAYGHRRAEREGEGERGREKERETSKHERKICQLSSLIFF